MDDELRKKFAAWKVKPEIPPDFQRGVWNRIAARELRSAREPFLGLWAVGLLSVRRLAACALVLAALIGTGLGLIQSSRANATAWKTLEAKYVQSIDPYEHLRAD